MEEPLDLKGLLPFAVAISPREGSPWVWNTVLVLVYVSVLSVPIVQV